ncbi:MAG TPA: PBP1A family penicillin-binding protein [Pyrinomonadaceae bacterium]|nr:PBP1A family penicillin-binding protein [Pyrinomonadaceae bacterium]
MAIEVSSIHKPRRARFRPRIRVMKQDEAAAPSRARRILFRSAIALAVLMTASLAFLIYSYISYSKIVDDRLASGYLTSRAGIYAAPRSLRTGQALSRDRLVELLRRAGYVETDASDVWSGSFTVLDDAVEILPRHASAGSPLSTVRVSFNKHERIAEIRGDGVQLEYYQLEPEILTTDAGMKSGKRAALSYADIPPTLVRAILSIEDRRFFEHRGLDAFGIGRAILRNAGDNELGQGGSTITQQLVKNTYLSPERTFRRKFAEAMLAFTLERRLSKEDIFALYANEIYLGQRGSVGVRGVEQAARIYFGKELKDLTLAESAAIAGMIQSPSRYSPERHADTAIARRNTVLGTMVRDGAITLEEARAAASEPMNLAPAQEGGTSLAPYFVDYVNRVVESQLAESSSQDERSLRVYTTIDPELQQLAETAIRRQLERLDKAYKGKAMPQAALVALDPKTGDVLAMVGGRDYASSQLNRATDARRQPGSVFKPIVYTAALESGLSPLSLYMDAPREFSYDRRAKYRPANYGDHYSMQDVTMRTGLIKSLNVVTVDVSLRAGLQRVAQTAQTLGLPKPEPYPALALGTTEATPLEMAAAYTAFANEGRRVSPRVIARATDAEGSDIVNTMPVPTQVIKPTTAYMITDMLTDVIDHGTARAARGAVRGTVVAGKTGTSRDGWFVGYTPNLVCAVWIGFDDNKQLGLTGAEAALPAWTEFVKAAVEQRPELGGEKFDRPAGITTVEVDPETGMVATPACPQRERVAVTSNFVTTAECYKHNQMFEIIASDDTENTEPPVVYVDEMPRSSSSSSSSERDAAARRRTFQPTTPPAITNDVEYTTPYGSTRVESVRGRQTLVNEMRKRP